MNTELMKYVESFDNGDEVRTVIMGGIVEGYEVAIQDLAIENMRTLMMLTIPKKAEDISGAVSFASENAVNLLDKKHGFSGAQVGAAKNLSAIFWRKGPIKAIESLKDEDRKITMHKTQDGNIVFNKKIGE